MGYKLPSCTCFLPILTSRQPLIVFEAQVSNSMGVHSSSISLNNIRLSAPSVDPPALRCKPLITCPLHPFGHGPGFFSPTYKIIPFAVFQKTFVGSSNRSSSFNAHSNPQNCSIPSPSSLCQGVSGHHLLGWRLNTSLPPQIHVTIIPITRNKVKVTAKRLQHTNQLVKKIQERHKK